MLCLYFSFLLYLPSLLFPILLLYRYPAAFSIIAQYLPAQTSSNPATDIGVRWLPDGSGVQGKGKSYADTIP